MKTYTIIYEPEDNGWWFVSIEELQGCHSQGKNLNQARERIEEALELFEDSLEGIKLVDDIRLPEKEQALVNEYLKIQQELKEKREALQTLSKKTAQELKKNLGISHRDTGQLMHISHQRVHQLIK